MLVTLDNLASRYNLLPSQALSNATTFDLIVLNTSTLWENHKHEQATRDPSDPKQPPKVSEEQMLDMLDKVRNKS